MHPACELAFALFGTMSVTSPAVACRLLHLHSPEFQLGSEGQTGARWTVQCRCAACARTRTPCGCVIRSVV